MARLALMNGDDESAASDTDPASEVEKFLEKSGFHHQLVLEGFSGHFKCTLEGHGFHAAAIRRCGPGLKIRVIFPLAYTPSKKFKLYQMMHALIRESGYKARHLWLVVNKRRVSMWIMPQSD